MTPLHHYLLRFGMAGLPFDAPARLHNLERWLNWPLFAALFLAIPAFYIEISGAAAEPEIQALGAWFILAIALSFTAHLGVMLLLYPHRGDYLRRNWMHLLIIFGTALNYLDVGMPQTSADWVLRIVWQVTAFIRLTGFLTGLIKPGSLGSVLLLAVATLSVSGLGFYWLEPTVHSYGDGMWLAFISAATVGYGDLLPTTTASRIFAVFIVLLGYAVLSLVTANIAALLIGEGEEKLRREMHRDVRALRQEVAELRRAIDNLSQGIGRGK